MADLDRVLRALHNADAAGDVEAAKHLAQLARSMSQPQEETSFEDQLAALRPDYSVGEIVSRGVTRGAKQLGSALGDVLPAIVGSGLGFKDYAKRQMDEAAQTQEEIQATNAPQFTSYKQVDGLGSAAMFGLETISEQLPNILTSIIPGVGLEAVAARTIAADAAKGFAVRAAEKGLVGDAAEAYVTKGVQSLAPQIAAKAQTAQNVGIYLGSYAQSAPEIFQGIYDETGEMAPGASLVFGAVAGALDSVLPAKLARTLTGPVKAGVVEKILEKSGMERGLLRAVTANTLETMGVEGITEGAQEAIGIAAERFINDNPGVFGDKEWNRILESSIRGAIAGGPFGAIEGAGDAAKEGAERKQRYQDIKQQRAVRDRDTATGKALDEYQARARSLDPQALLPGIEPEPYVSSVIPTEIDPRSKEQKKAAEVVQKGLDKRDTAQAGKQTEMFAERASPKDELKLSPFAQKVAERNAKRAAVLAKEEADRNAKRIAVLAKEEAKALQVAEQAKTKLERESAKRRAAALKSERVRLTKQVEEQLWFSDEDVKPRPLPSDVAPAEQGETFDMFGAPISAPAPVPAPAPVEPVAEPIVRGPLTVATLPTTLPEDLKVLGKVFGLRSNAPILKQLVGKDLTKPEVVADLRLVISTLIEAQNKKAPNAESTKRFGEFLARPEFQVPVSESSATEVKSETGGTSSEGSVLSEEPTGKGSTDSNDTGMDDTGIRTPVPDAGKGGSGSSLDKFSTEAKADAVSQSGSDKSRTKLIEVSIDDFLNLATDAGEGGYTDTKLQKARSNLASGFTSVPQLTVDKNGKVTGHEGRHRALALKEAGYTTMPVLLTSENIRWDRQHDETDTDYVGDDKWPKRLQAQKGARSKKFSIPYPINRDNAWVGTYHTKKPEKVVAKPAAKVEGRIKKPAKKEAADAALTPLPPDYIPFEGMEGVEYTFRTGRGSTYAHLTGGTTVRNRSGKGHTDTTTGLQPRSGFTIYLSEKGINDVSGWIQNPDVGTKFIPEINKNGKSTGNAQVILTENYGPQKAGTVVATAPFKTTPEVGLSPVEIWNSDSPPKTAGDGIHFGNKITEVNKTLADKAPADKPPAKVKGRIKKPPAEEVGKPAPEILKLLEDLQFLKDQGVSSTSINGLRKDLQGPSPTPDAIAAAQNFITERMPAARQLAGTSDASLLDRVKNRKSRSTSSNEVEPTVTEAPDEKKAEPKPKVDVNAAVAKRRAELEKQASNLRNKAAAAHSRKTKPISDAVYEAAIDNINKGRFARAEGLIAKEVAPEKNEDGQYYGPKYKGASFDADTRRLVEQGNVNGAINRIMQRSNPAIRAVLRKILSLNLGVKVKIGDPTGRFKYAPEEPKNLKRWLGKTRHPLLIDKNGDPIPYYHGTGADITKFKAKQAGAIFVSPTTDFAGHYADKSQMYLERRGMPGGANVLKLFVSAENPFDVDTLGHIDALVAHINKSPELRKQLRGEFGSAFDLGKTLESTRHYAELGGRYVANWSALELKSVIQAIKELGHDGFFINEDGQKNIGVFSPNQLKSATGNTGAYSLNDNDIRYAEGAGGSYDPTTNTITLDPEMGLNDHIFIHELIHAALVKVLANPNLKITKDFTKFFTQIKERLGDAYGGQNLQEFAAELVSNPEFQALLKTIKAPRSESLFKRIMQAIANFFGFPPNVYSSGLKFINDAIDISEGVEVLPWDMMFYGPGNFQAVADIGKGMTKLAGNTINATRNNLSNLKGGGLAKAAFGMLSLGNIHTLYGKELPSIKSLMDALELRAGTSEKQIAAANAKYKDFMKVQEKEAAAVSRMNDMAIAARLAEVDILDPSFKPTATNRAEYNRLKGVFNTLPTSVQNIYRTIRKDYDSTFTAYKNMILKSVSPSLAAKMQTQFTAALNVVGYVPFLRSGDFWVEYTDPSTNERAASAFESVRERQLFIDTQLKPKGIVGKPYKNLESIRFDTSSVPATHFVAQIMRDLQAQGKAKGLSKAAVDAQMDSVYQSYLALMPGASIVKQFMKSKNVGGMEKDIIRGYGDIMVRWARKIAATEYNPQIDLALDEIVAQAHNSNDDTVSAAAENIMAQRDFYHNPTFTPLVHAATTFSYFEYIAANISSAIVNLTSLPLLVWPMLSRYGFGKATNAMMSASRVAMGDWSKGKYSKLYETLNDHGQLQHTTAREILEGRRQKTSEYTDLKARALNVMSIPFATTERYNRAVTAIAAYELARGAGKTAQEAIEIALTTTKDAHTSGMAATSPRWMQHPIGRVFFTFKTFAWNSAFITARAFHQAAKGQTPDVRKAARRQLIGMFGMAGAFAGAKGLPFYGAATTLGTMLQAMLGDDDEPFDIHEELREFFGELGYKGPVNYLLNLEIANRAAVATDLVFRDDPRGVEENGYVMSAFKNALGPTGSYLVGAERGFAQMREGQVERGMEAIMPSWIRNGFKGGRYMMEGALTLKGDPVDTDISTYNSFMQMFGFSPADLSSTYEKVSAAKGYEKELNDKRQRLLNLYDMARTSGDMELMQEAKERIREYRLAGVGKEISYKTLDQSYKARRAAEKEMIHGVRFDKQLKRQIEEKFFADDDEE